MKNYIYLLLILFATNSQVLAQGGRVFSTRNYEEFNKSNQRLETYNNIRNYNRSQAQYKDTQRKTQKQHGYYSTIRQYNRNNQKNVDKSQIQKRSLSRLEKEHYSELLKKLPKKHTVIHIGSRRYYFYKGIYFEQTMNKYYIRCSPPLGARITSLPNGYRTVSIGATRYYYYRNCYYYSSGNGYISVQAPIGHVVRILPRGSQVVYLDGKKHHYAGSVYYKPYITNNVLMYKVVKIER